MPGPGRGRPARPSVGGRPQQRRPARPAATARRASRGSDAITGRAADEPRRRVSFTSRAAVLALVLTVLAISYAYPLRAWYDQHSRRSAVEEEAAELRASIDELEQELRLWDDPAYVMAQARQRLNFVLPGEVGYVVVDESGEVTPVTTAEGIPVTADGPWYSRLWASLEAADAMPLDGR